MLASQSRARRKTASLRAPAARALEAAQEVADVADAALGPGHASKGMKNSNE